MNKMNQHDMNQHVPILGWLYVVGHAIFLAIGAFVFLLLIGLAPVTGEAEAMWVLTLVGTTVGLLMAVLGLPGVIAGYGLLRRKPWARTLAIVVGILNLINFPVGTAIGLYTLWVLTQPAATEYFAAPAPA
ncbi:MAG TPA: hypothetical protein VFU22_13855 [Roseiflexaceae bacterium]|nr:hypothetical protein [Roseiflexaceae bacterium]